MFFEAWTMTDIDTCGCRVTVDVLEYADGRPKMYVGTARMRCDDGEYLTCSGVSYDDVEKQALDDAKSLYLWGKAMAASGVEFQNA